MYTLSLPNNLLLYHELCSFWIPCKLIQLLLCGIFLGYLKLSLDLALDCLLVVSLDLLSFTKYVFELGCYRPIDDLLHSCFRLRFLIWVVLGKGDVACHLVQLALDRLLVNPIFTYPPSDLI